MSHALRYNPEAMELAQHFDSLHKFCELAEARKKKHKKKRTMSKEAKEKRRKSVAKRRSVRRMNSAAATGPATGGAGGPGSRRRRRGTVTIDGRVRAASTHAHHKKRESLVHKAERIKRERAAAAAMKEGAPSSRDALVARLKAFYEEHAPEQVAKAEAIVDKCVEKFGGVEAAEQKLNESLAHKFGGKHL